MYSVQNFALKSLAATSSVTRVIFLYPFSSSTRFHSDIVTLHSSNCCSSCWTSVSWWDWTKRSGSLSTRTIPSDLSFRAKFVCLKHRHDSFWAYLTSFTSFGLLLMNRLKLIFYLFLLLCHLYAVLFAWETGRIV